MPIVYSTANAVETQALVCWRYEIQINDKITVVTVCKDAHDTEMPTR